MYTTTELHSAKLIPILEPLSTATESVITPVRMFQTDYLEVDITDDLKKFHLTAVCRSTTTFGNVSSFWDKLIRKIPERTEVQRGVNMGTVPYQIMCGATYFSALVLYHNIPEDRFIWKRPEAKMVYDYIIKKFIASRRRMEMVAAFKLNKEVPPLPKDWINHYDESMRLAPSQQLGVMFALEQEGSAWFMEQGTGKTPTAVQLVSLEAARTRAGKYVNSEGRPYPHMYRVLIVCPKQVRTNWEREFERFAVVPGKTTVIRGGPIKRIQNLIDGVRNEDDCAFGACICSFNAVDSTFEALAKINWDRIIIDESHYIKANGADRSRACRRLRDISLRRLILTGTPIANTPNDLFSQLEALYEGCSGFMVYERFKKFYGQYELLGHGIEKLTGLKNIPLLQEALARNAYMLTKDEAGLNLPPKTYDIYEVSMTARQARLYVQVQEQMLAEIKSLLADTTKRITAEHILTKMLRLAQITSGHVVYDAQFDEATGDLMEAKSIEQISEQNPKVQAIIDIVTDESRDPKGKTIVWAVWREDIRVIYEALTKQGIKCVKYDGTVSDVDREAAVKAFNFDKECKVFIGTPATGGAGLNLVGYDYTDPARPGNDTFCDRVVFFSQNWSSTERSQAEDRAHRRGTRGTVTITDLVVRGTIDEEIRCRVTGKQSMAKMVQDVKDIMGRVLNTELESDED